MNDFANLIIGIAVIMWGYNNFFVASHNVTSQATSVSKNIESSGSLLNSEALPIFEGSIFNPNPNIGSLLSSSTLPIFSYYGSGSAIAYRAKNPPADVVNYLKTTIKSRYPNVPIYVYLAICYHERGIINWRDDYLCGYGSYDGSRSGWKASIGWQYQFDNLARIINRDAHTGRFQGYDTGTTCYEYQMFAKHSWKTTAWQTHCRSADYAKHYKRWLNL